MDIKYKCIAPQKLIKYLSELQEETLKKDVFAIKIDGRYYCIIEKDAVKSNFDALFSAIFERLGDNNYFYFGDHPDNFIKSVFSASAYDFLEAAALSRWLLARLKKYAFYNFNNPDFCTVEYCF